MRGLIALLTLVFVFATPASARVFLSLPSGVVEVEATGPGGATYTYDDTGLVCTPSGFSFPLGDTPVSCVDGGGADAGSFTVRVRDTIDPVVTLPSDLPKPVTTGVPPPTVVTYGAGSASDAVTPSPTVTCSPASGSSFPAGTTTVTCSATDAAGNTGSAQSTVTVTVVDGTPPTLTVPGNMTREATGPGGAAVTFSTSATDAIDPAPAVTCNHASGSTFPLGVTTVSCTAKDASNNTSAPQTFTITVKDTTAPTITSIPSGTVTVPATSASGASYSFTVTASDLVDSTPTITCNHGPGSEPYALGTTHVSCTAKDDANNTSSASGFDVTVTDTVAPTFTSIPSGTLSRQATGPGGAVVTFTVTASDAIDPSPTVTCNHPSGSTFLLGTTAVSCTAKDSSNNTSAPAGFNVSVTDTVAPTFTSIPSGTLNRQATGPGGAVVTFTVTASDAIDPAPSVSCNHPSGGTFPLGNTQVSCTAKDSSNNTSAASVFTVNVVDTTKPDVQSPPDIAVEANGPTGAKVNFPNPVAVDLVDGPVPNVSCSPASGSTFGLGTHVVNCSASDSHGNTASASIKVTVADTTPPNLLTPVSLGIHADSPTGIPRSNSTITSYLRSAIASDIVDPNPVVTNNAPDNLPIGTTDITYTARDASGNTTSKSSAIVVLPKPPPGTPPLPVPPAPTLPAEVKNVKVTPMDGAVRIQWQAGGRQVMVTRSSSSNLKRSLAAIGDERVVYTGTASSYVDRGLENKVEYRYVVRAVDAAGNHSAGVAAVVVPRRDLLKSPKDGARLRKAPRLLWTPDAEAQYYNAQLLLNGAKVLSVWPKGPTYVMKKSWKFNGRKYTLKPGLYSWYVWPGFGARPAAQYGDLIGSRTFRIVR